MKHLICIFATAISVFFSQPSVAAGSNLVIDTLTEWQPLGSDMWMRTITWQSGLKETLILSRDARGALISARSVCTSVKDRLVVYTWSPGDKRQQSATAIGCYMMPVSIPIYRWDKAVYPLPEGL